MKTLEIYKTRKNEIVEKTIELLPVALKGDRVNRAFYIKFDNETDKLIVDYFCFTGQQELGDDCFYVIRDYETPDPRDYGYESFDEMGFYICGFAEAIKNSINEQISWLKYLTARKTGILI